MVMRLLLLLVPCVGLVRSLPLPQAMMELPSLLPPLGPCMEALHGVLGNKEILAQMLVATGKDLPYDAGKYQTCMNIKEASGFPTKFFIVSFVLGSAATPGEIGICLPAVCKNADIELIRDVLAAGNGTVASLAKSVRFPKYYDGDDYPAPELTVVYPNPFNDQDNRLSWGSGTSAAIAVWILLVVVVIYCTAVEYRLRSSSSLLQPTPRLKLLRAFALLGPEGSWTALTKAEPRRPSDCLNGLRVLSMVFVIIGHSQTQPRLSAGFRNSECVAKTPYCLDAPGTSPLINLVFCGECAVDTFFFMGGFLLSLIGLSRSTPVLMGTGLRYARLLPCFGFVQMIYVLVAPYWTFGPFSPRFQADIFLNCSNATWWSELLFISAFYPWNYPKGCMGWSWYLGLDMMFAILGLALLNVYKKLPTAAWLLVMAMTAACLVVCMQQSLHYNLQYSLFGPHEGDYQFHLYSKFYSRIPVFMVGLCAPWAMQSMQRGQQPRSHSASAIVMSCCVVAIAIGACIIFLPAWNAWGPGPYSTARKVDNWTPWQNAWFIAFSRPVWALCCLVIVLACYYEYLPLLDNVLSHQAWAPLTKLTYGAYLLHPVIIKSLAGSSMDYYRFAYAEVFYHSAGYIILAYSASFLLWCLVERPMASLTGLLAPKSRAGQSKPARDPSPCSVEEGTTPLSAGAGLPSREEGSQR